MTELQLRPILGLDDAFPDSLWILHHPESSKYACYQFKGIHGLASFSSQESLDRFRSNITLDGMVDLQVDFDQAREIAKARPLPVTALMLVDQLDDPKIHFVR